MSAVLAGFGMMLMLLGLGLLAGLVLVLLVLGVIAIGEMIDAWVARVLR